MTTPSDTTEPMKELLAEPDLAEALASDRFKQFLDHVPVAIIVSELIDEVDERLVYLNREAELIVGLPLADVEGWDLTRLDQRIEVDDGAPLSDVLVEGGRAWGAVVAAPSDTVPVRRIELQAALVTDDAGRARFRLVALIDVTERDAPQREAFEARLRDKDVLLREIQHRVKNNLQIVTALIRMEARRAGTQIGTGPFERLAGRIEALGLLYQQLSLDDAKQTVDLGPFLSLIAGSVLKGQGVDGVRLDLQVDSCPTSVNVAMPVGLLVNELLTNSLKYAFEGRTEGVLTVRCLKAGDDEYVVSVSDDGGGFADGTTWPQPGKLGALMVRSLEDNAKAKVDVASSPGAGVTTTIRFRLAPPTATGADAR